VCAKQAIFWFRPDVDTGSYSWDAAKVLIGWLCAHKVCCVQELLAISVMHVVRYQESALIQDGNLLELGCGTASVSLVAAKLKLQHASHRGSVMATDASFASSIEERIR